MYYKAQEKGKPTPAGNNNPHFSDKIKKKIKLSGL